MLRAKSSILGGVRLLSRRLVHPRCFGMIAAGDLKKGQTVRINDKLLTLMERDIAAMGRRYTALQFTFRDLASGGKIPIRLAKSDQVELIEATEKQELQLLYSNADTMFLMNPEDSEQLELPLSLLGEKAAYLQDGMMLMVKRLSSGDTIVGLPTEVECVVESVEVGDRADASLAKGKLTNGRTVMVPRYVQAGSRIVVRPEGELFDRTAENRTKA